MFDLFLRLKHIVLLLTVNSCVEYSYSQVGLEKKFMRNSFYSIGSTYGLNPNYRNNLPEGYYFIEGRSDLTVKNIPLSVRFRYSNEELYTGRSSFFKISYNNALHKLDRIEDYAKKIQQNNQAIADLNAENYELKSKISFINTLKNNNKFEKYVIKQDYPSELKIEAPPLNLPLTPSIGIPDVSSSTLNLSTFQLDSLQEKLNFNLRVMDSLNLDNYKINNKYLSQIPVLNAGKFTNKKFDIGMTTLSESSMSSNSIPIHGLSGEIETDRYFYGGSVGFTLPNQLLSNQIFEQILYNNYNTFNQGDFFIVDKINFVAGSKIGYGRKRKSYIGLENYYIGSQFNSSLKRIDSGLKALNTNLVFQKILLPRLIVSGGLGFTQSFSDSLPNRALGLNDLAVTGKVNYNSKNDKRKFELLYRKIPSSYDSWIIGVNNRATERTSFKYHQFVSRKLKLTIRGAVDKINLPDSSKNSFRTEQVGADISLRLAKNVSSFGSYTILNMTDRSTKINQQYNHLLKLGFSTLYSKKESRFVTIHDLSYARFFLNDTISELQQFSTKYNFDRRNLLAGLEVRVTNFTGTGHFSGQNIIVNPHIGYKNKHGYVSISYNRLWSERYGNRYGGVVKVGLVFDEYIDLEFQATSFLPTEFIHLGDAYLQYNSIPYFARLSLNIKVP